MAPVVFLGVDGGGTKTEFVLVDSEGNLLGSVTGEGCYHLEIGMEGLRNVLAKGIADVVARAAINTGQIAHAFFGIPAYGEDSEAQVLLDAMPAALLGHRRYRCGNDMVCAWAGSLAGEDGINIVAGTGSIGYGERGGKAARAGGWGEVFGDEGSAYWIAVQGLNVYTRMSDGRMPKGLLYALFRHAFRLEADLDLCARVLNNHTRDSIAAIAQLVTRAAQESDAAAIRIFDSAANELAAVVDAVRRALDFAPDEIVPLSYSGGVFHAGALILDPFRRHLAARCPRFDLRTPLLSPSIGAAVYAAKLAGSPLPAALQHLRDVSVAQ
ncbi:MAG: N-acetylglucosamine kinase [Xanthobacteraceae bacterium]